MADNYPPPSYPPAAKQHPNQPDYYNNQGFQSPPPQMAYDQNQQYGGMDRGYNQGYGGPPQGGYYGPPQQGGYYGGGPPPGWGGQQPPVVYQDRRGGGGGGICAGLLGALACCCCLDAIF